MVSLMNIQKIFRVPSDWTLEQKNLASKMIMDQIKKNTKSGISADGSPFPKYSASYKNSLDFENAGKTSKVNLNLSGDMIASLEVIDIGRATITIGYTKDSDLSGQVEGNQIGSYGSDSGNSAKARPFIGLPDEQLSKIIEEISRLSGNKELEEATVSSSIKQDKIISSLLSRFFSSGGSVRG